MRSILLTCGFYSFTMQAGRTPTYNLVTGCQCHRSGIMMPERHCPSIAMTGGSHSGFQLDFAMLEGNTPGGT